MPATKISDLLPISESTVDPHPYQVFGLEDGEQDIAKISKAVQGVVAKLKAAKAETDPKLWAKTAKLVQRSRVTLANAESKAQLDARFGIIAVNEEPTSPEDPLAAVLPSSDPLANMLPMADPTAPLESQASTDPLAALLPSTDPSASAATSAVPDDSSSQGSPGPDALAITGDLSAVSVSGNTMPASVFGSPVLAQPSAKTLTAGGPVVVTAEDHLRSGSGKARKRKKPILGVLMFGTFAFGMLALIGTLIYFLVFGPGQVAITNAGGQLTISTEPDEGDERPVVSPPRDVPNDRPSPQPLDPVMGTLANGEAPPTTGPSELATQLRNGMGEKPPTAPSMIPNNGESMGMTTPDMTTPGTTPPNTTTPDTTPTAPIVVDLPADPPMESEPAEPPLSDETIAEVDKKLIELSLLIKTADWKQMKPVAEAITEMRMTEEQQGHADALYELADLATYYRGGIEKAIADLDIGNDFAVTDDFRVIVVEKGDDLLVVRYNERNRSWTFDELPFSLAHKLATFTVPPSPTGEAAKAVYQAVAPKSSKEYRQESLEILRGMNGEVKGADPEALADTIEALFKEGA